MTINIQLKLSCFFMISEIYAISITKVKQIKAIKSDKTLDISKKEPNYNDLQSVFIQLYY